MREKLHFRVVLREADARVPEQKHPGDAGYDIRACLPYGDWDIVVVEPGEYVQVPTGIAIAIDPGYFIRLTARSSTQWHVLEGVIDAGYRGEIMVGVQNPSNKPLIIRHGDRIAQFVIHERIEAEWEVVARFEDTTVRGENGFGSTGRS